MTCNTRFYPHDRPLTGSLNGLICDREEGHPPPHRHGPKVYCGEIYQRSNGLMYYCNLDLKHPGDHGREPVSPPPRETRWEWLKNFATRVGIGF